MWRSHGSELAEQVEKIKAVVGGWLTDGGGVAAGSAPSAITPPQLSAEDRKLFLSESVCAPQLKGTKLGPGVLGAPVLTEAFGAYLLELLDSATARLPKGDGGYGARGLHLLDAPYHLRSVFDALADALTQSLLSKAYKQLRLHCTAAFLVHFHAGDGNEDELHVDDSDLTVNACLGKKFTGGALRIAKNVELVEHVLSQARMALQVATQSRTMSSRPNLMPDTLFAPYEHRVGHAIIHRGAAYHAPEPLTSGERVNLVLWFRAESAAATVTTPAAAAAPRVAFLDLPVEVQELVLGRLHPFDLEAVAAVCRHLYGLARGNTVWNSVWQHTPPPGEPSPRVRGSPALAIVPMSNTGGPLPPPRPSPFGRAPATTAAAAASLAAHVPAQQVPAPAPTLPAWVDPGTPGSLREAYVQQWRSAQAQALMRAAPPVMMKRAMPRNADELMRQWGEDMRIHAAGVVHALAAVDASAAGAARPTRGYSRPIDTDLLARVLPVRRRRGGVDLSQVLPPQMQHPGAPTVLELAERYVADCIEHVMRSDELRQRAEQHFKRPGRILF